MSKDQKAPESNSAPENEASTAKREATREVYDADHIKELRERLYSRGNVPTHTVRHMLERHEIHDTMETPPQKEEIEAPSVMQLPVQPQAEAVSSIPPQSGSGVVSNNPMVNKSRRKSYRSISRLFQKNIFLLEKNSD